MSESVNPPSSGDASATPHPALRAYEERLNHGPPLAPADFLALHPECPVELLPELEALHAAYSALSVPLPNLPGYEILRELGRGGMGVVYLAHHEALDRPVALKVLRPWPTPDATALARFDAEARAAARLSHPNVVRIFDVGRHDGLPFLALEYVPGQSLASLLAAGPIDPRRATALLLPLARAVQQAHEHGVVHRDIKPGNILLSSEAAPGEDLPRLTDFGLAKLIDAESVHTGSGQILGTLAYVAPEQTQTGTEVGPAADIYGLGAILYECLTGQPPLGRLAPAELIDRVRNQPPQPPRKLRPEVHRDLEAVCLKCLEKEPAHRYATAQELVDDLTRFLANEPTVARPLTHRQRLGRFIVRHRRSLTLTGLAVGLGLFAGLGDGAVLLVQAYHQEVALRHRAEESQRLTLESVRELTEIVRLHVRHTPGRQREEIQILQTVLRIAEEAATDLPTDHPLHGEVALLLLRLCEAKDRVGEEAASDQYLHRSLTLLRVTVRARPDDRRLRWQLVMALTGSASRAAGVHNETADQHLTEAGTHLTMLLAADPNNAEYLDRKVHLLFASARVHIESKRWDEAATQLDETLAISD